MYEYSLRVCWFGSLGSGKTMGAVKEAYRYSVNHPDNKIYSNVPLNTKIIKNYVPLKSLAQLLDINEACCILQDEKWYTSDSRTIQSPENKIDNLMLLRSRKKGWLVLYTQQWYTQLDLRQRFITDLWIMPQYHKKQEILQEDIYDLHANYIATRFYDATAFFDLYFTHDDPLTIDLEQVRKEYNAKKEKASTFYKSRLY